MNRYSNHAAKAYANVGIESSAYSANPHQLISMLLDATLVAIVKAKHHMQKQELVEKGNTIAHAVTLIDSGLRGSLNFEQGGELASNLDNLYSYMIKQLLNAHLHNQVELLDEVYKLMNEIKSAWASIAGNNQISSKEFSPVSA